jgi:hypothetical protein
VNRQNRMNAGAEYVLYRIWATLQGQNGIHAESLLACLGGLAGHSCQMYVRQSAALPGADPRKYSLLTVDAIDGTKYLAGDALMGPLVESSLSVWSFVGRAVQKLDKPLPDIQDIVRHVSQTVGTGAFGVPRAPDGHRPHHPASVYVKQLWPQILPIAERFCRKPGQIPVLFGIALQRAIEHTKDTLSPTLGASIAMECAVAMAKVALPGDDAGPPIARPIVIAVEPGATGLVGTDLVAMGPVVTPRPIPSPARGKSAEPVRASRARKKRNVGDTESGAPRVGALVARIPPAARIVTIAALAFLTVSGALYEAGPEVPVASVGERALAGPRLAAATLIAQATPEPQSAQDAQSSQESQVRQEPTSAVEMDAPTVAAAEPLVDSSDEYAQVRPQTSSDNSDDGLMRDEFGRPMQ